MSNETKSVKARVRKRSHEGVIVKSFSRKESGRPVDDTGSTERFVAIDEEAPAFVGVSGKLTKNLGNYESAQIGISITLPCPPTDAGVRGAHAQASKLVEEFIDLELKNAGIES